MKAGYPIPEAQVLFERLDKKVAEEETEKLENPKFNEVQNIHGRNRLLDELARKGGWSIKITTLIVSKKPGNTGKSRNKDTEFTTHLLHSEGALTRCPFP